MPRVSRKSQQQPQPGIESHSHPDSQDQNQNQTIIPASSSSSSSTTAAEERETRLQRALARLADPCNTLTVSAIAQEEGVTRSTLSRRVQLAAESQKTQLQSTPTTVASLMTPEEEQGLVLMVLRCGRQFKLLSKQDVIKLARRYIGDMLNDSDKAAKVNLKWVKGFLERYPEVQQRAMK